MEPQLPESEALAPSEFQEPDEGLRGPAEGRG